MRELGNSAVTKSHSIRQVMESLDRSQLQFAAVLDDNGRLLGTVTDGDVRRALLSGATLDDRIESFMKQHSTVAYMNQSEEEILNLALAHDVRQLPVIDEDGRVIGVEIVEDYLRKAEKPNTVVLMAGGLGTRLRPLTKDTPKPMLRVGNKPILQTILENFERQGFKRFIISVNYKAEVIKEHFNTGEHLGIEISYLEETERLGTAGALRLMQDSPTKPFFVMNGDLVTNINFVHLLTFHNFVGAQATMAVTKHDYQVPYGVIHSNRNLIEKIDEKPTNSVFINSGIYVLSPECLEHIPSDRIFDMTDLFNTLMENGLKTCCYKMSEFWLDVGKAEDLERANKIVGKAFNV